MGETVPFWQFFRNRLIGHALSIIEYFLGNHFFSNDLKTPSVEMACLLDIQNEIQAV